MKILFLGDVFGDPGITALEKNLKKLVNKHKIDFVIVQGENASGRKGLIPADYKRLIDAGVGAITMGNHVWAKDEICSIINNKEIVRPYNISGKYPGSGSRVFKVKGQTIRVSQFLGIAFNELNGNWKERQAVNFFDAFDYLQEEVQEDYHIIDFHAETTSEKNVFGLYIDGKADAFIGTHTHIQTNDARVLPHGSLYITDVGMVGPTNSAIGASYESVYKKMRYGTNVKFGVSENSSIINGVILSFNKNSNSIDVVYAYAR